VNAVDGSRSETSPALSQAPHPAAHHRGSGKRRILQDFLWGLLTTAVLVGANVLFENTPFGEAAVSWGDSLVQNHLIAPVQPVVRVVDISGLAPVSRERNGRFIYVTPRKELKDLIAAIAAMHPLAIGVDIDFAPDRFGIYASPDEDPGFFNEMIDLRRRSGVPIYLASNRAIGLSPKYWLGSDAYSSLAASAMLPKPLRTSLTRIGVGDQLGPTMSAALANAAASRSHTEAIRWPEWLATRNSPWVSGRFRGEQYVVDYSMMWAIMGQIINASKPSDVTSHASMFTDRVVLLGDTPRTRTTDTCVIPASVPGVDALQPQPCVFVHASGVFTLLQAPLYQLTLRARIAIDLALSIFVLGTVAVVRLHYHKARAAPEWLLYGGGFALAAATVLACISLVRSTRLVWDDFALVIVAFALHSSADRKLGALRHLRLAAKGTAVIAICLGVSLVPHAAYADPASTEVGTIRKIVPPVFLRPSAGGTVIKLDPARDTNRAVFPGQAVRCGPGGRVVLNLQGNRVTPTPCTTWYEIPFPASDHPETEDERLIDGARGGYDFGYDQKAPLDLYRIMDKERAAFSCVVKTAPERQNNFGQKFVPLTAPRPVIRTQDIEPIKPSEFPETLGAMDNQMAPNRNTSAKPSVPCSARTSLDR
jgi:CHASE2 domain